MTGNRCPNPTGIDQRNTARAERGRAALIAYAETMPGYQLGEEDEHAVSDLITDLLHYVTTEGWQYRPILERAVNDYQCEQEET